MQAFPDISPHHGVRRYCAALVFLVSTALAGCSANADSSAPASSLTVAETQVATLPTTAADTIATPGDTATTDTATTDTAPSGPTVSGCSLLSAEAFTKASGVPVETHSEVATICDYVNDFGVIYATLIVTDATTAKDAIAHLAAEDFAKDHAQTLNLGQGALVLGTPVQRALLASKFGYDLLPGAAGTEISTEQLIAILQEIVAAGG